MTNATIETTAPPSPFCIPENVVIEKTGLARRDLRDNRGPRGERWQKIGAQLLWSAEGVADLETHLAKKIGAAATPDPVEAPPVQIFTVVRARNTRVLHVITEGEAYDAALPRCVWLPQPRAQLFTPGMKVAATSRHGRDDLFDLVGNPQPPGRRWPRRRGKW